jgi:hypothetical protein
MERSLLPLLVAAFTLTGTVLGSAQQDMMYLGAGVKSCGTWTQERRNSVTSGYYEQWVAGFLTAVNLTIGQQLKIDLLERTDQKGIYAWIDNYCVAHPLNTIVEGADVLGAELITKAKAAKQSK